MTRRYALVHHEPPWTANEQRRRHWSWLGERTAEWRFTFQMLAREAKVPALAACSLEVTHYYTAHVPDVGACSGALKAACDGLVDAGVIPDDDPAHLLSVTYAVRKLPDAWKRPGVRGALGIVVVETETKERTAS